MLNKGDKEGKKNCDSTLSLSESELNRQSTLVMS